ncbi:hypothetical protein HCN44_007107 [Aphidius gifuensis]|uniref:Uncharacterized protein n=1 Tax=Aphidius gifuensis TaxID=684658 RepID=A0A834XKZ2_APHGI|nr:hypothetical protein HCN44_007107 [Aphidius gifuensis]
MEKPNRNETIVIEIKEEFNEDMTMQLESIKEEVLDKVENNCEISRDTQSTIVEHQQQQDHQQQPETIEIKRELIIDYEISNNNIEKVAEQIPSCSTNFDYPGYPGFIEAVRQAKGKKKSYDVSFQMLFSCFPESVITQHDIHLNEWWNYCVIRKKDPLETGLSVFIGYLEKKLDAGVSCDDLKSIASSVCLIASDKMASQIHSLSFLFLEYAKYSPTNNTNGYKTPKLSCQNNSNKLSLHSKTKKQDGSKISSVQIENVQKAKLSEVIDISDDHSNSQSPSTLMKKQTDVLNNNVPTTSKNKSVLLQKAMDNSQVTTPLMESSSTKPPGVKKSILPEIIDLSDNDSDTESPSTSLQKDVLNNNDQSNYKKHCVFLEKGIDKSQLTTPLMGSSKPTTKPPAIRLHSQKKGWENNVNEKPITGTINGPELLMQQAQLIIKPENDKINQQITIETTNPQAPSIMRINNVVVDESDLINQKHQTMPKLSIKQEPDEYIQHQESTLPLANNNQAIDRLTRTITPAIKLSTPAKLPVHLLTRRKINARVELEPFRKGIKRKRIKKTANLQTELGNAAPKNQQQQQQSEIKPATPATSLVLSQCQINKGALECLSQELQEIKIETTENLQSKLLLGDTVEKQQEQHQLPSATNNQEIDLDLLNDVAPSITSSASASLPLKLQISSRKMVTPAIQSPVHYNTSLLANTSTLECSSQEVKQNNVETTDNTVKKRQQEQLQKAQSYLKRKSSVQSVYINQSPKKLKQLMNLDEIDSKSIPDLSDRLIHSNNSSNEIELRTNTEGSLQLKDIDPQTTIVQDQIEGDVVRFLLVMSDGKQTVIPFNIPGEECTVNDLLEQAGILFNSTTKVSVIKDPILKVDHTVKSKIGTVADSTETSEVNNELSNDDNVLSDKKFLQDDNDHDENDDEDDDDDDDDSDDGSDDDWVENLNLRSKLMCHLVKIGSYKYTPNTNNCVEIKKSGLELSVPLDVNEIHILKINVEYRDIVKVLIHTGKPAPILFFYTNTKSASKIRKLLGMNNLKRPYYDPASKDQTYQRIIIFPKLLKKKSINTLKKVFPSKVFMHKKLTEEEVNDIIYSKDASPEDLNNSLLNIDNRQTTINDTNNIVENPTIYSALLSKDEVTNANDENNEESNSVDDGLTNNNSKRVTSTDTIEKPKYVKGKFAVCHSCGSTSMDFNRCYRCKKKLPNNPKTKLDIRNLQQKICMIPSIDKFYRSLANNNININEFDNDIPPHTICSTSKNENSLSPGKNNTTDSDYNSEDTNENEIDNNKRKRLQLEVTAEEENPNKVLPSMPLID